MNDVVKAEIVNQIVRLNNNHGRGDVTGVDFTFDGDLANGGTFTRVPFQCVPERVKFRIVENVLFACRHQKSLPAVCRPWTA